MAEEIRPLNEHENAIIVVDDILGSTNSRYIGQFFIRGRHSKLESYCLSQSYFDLPKEQYELIVIKKFCLIKH